VKRVLLGVLAARTTRLSLFVAVLLGLNGTRVVCDGSRTFGIRHRSNSGGADIKATPPPAVLKKPVFG
jgi:hypothetical protein